MRRHVLVLSTVAAALLCCAGGAPAADIGANDDTGKWFPDGGTAFFGQMASLGLKQAVMSVRWEAGNESTIPYVVELDRSIAAATAAGLGVVLAVYPYPPREIELGRAEPWMFGSFTRHLAERYPQVRQFVIGNEPNQPAFWRPQYSRRTRANVSAKSFGAFLAAAYDGLKAHDPTLKVIGIGLSPRGNDRARAQSNVSTSPMRFLAALGRWYRASGRTAPLMDGLSFHPYPARATDPLERGYPWPAAGFVNLDRVKQAIWDAFAGTPQPTTLDGLKLYLDEVGWQVDTGLRPEYQGPENVPVTSEPVQAAIYGEIVRRVACDPDVAQVNFFGFYDDSLRTGFQAGLHRTDGTPRPSAEAVRLAIAEAPVCAATAPWAPAQSVVGATTPRVVSNRRGLVLIARSGEGATVVACSLPRGTSRAVALRALAGRRGAATDCVTGAATPQRPARIAIARGPALARGGTLAVELRSEANPARRATSVLRFR